MKRSPLVIFYGWLHFGGCLAVFWTIWGLWGFWWGVLLGLFWEVWVGVLLERRYLLPWLLGQ